MKEDNGYAIGETWLGTVIVGYEEGGIVAVLIAGNETDAVKALERRLPHIVRAGECNDLSDVIGTLATYGRGTLRKSEAPIRAKGTDFQKAVWRAISDIPYGETATYGEIAGRIGRSGASRAVASACAANPLAVLVPCHRVVARSGRDTGYAWGLPLKRRLLELEGSCKQSG
jgi:AraC family transcriptional regulator of adaptative response/methylated-DNA-[protein]-cysteine methyltransferase|nr:methylated-DNA--[protein]-cysteine S-methyltransferase [Neorhizobium tomejilense]